MFDDQLMCSVTSKAIFCSITQHKKAKWPIFAYSGSLHKYAHHISSHLNKHTVCDTTLNLMYTAVHGSAERYVVREEDLTTANVVVSLSRHFITKGDFAEAERRRLPRPNINVQVTCTYVLIHMYVNIHTHLTFWHTKTTHIISLINSMIRVLRFILDLMVNKTLIKALCKGFPQLSREGKHLTVSSEMHIVSSTHQFQINRLEIILKRQRRCRWYMQLVQKWQPTERHLHVGTANADFIRKYE